MYEEEAEIIRQIYSLFLGGSTYREIAKKLTNGSDIKAERLKQVREKLRRKETENANHIGLLNVNFRLSAFYNYAEEGIVLESCEGNGTTVTIFLNKGKIS